MDDLLDSVLAFPPSSGLSDTEFDKQAKQIVRKLGETPATVLTEKIADGQDILEILNPGEHTIAYVAVLIAHIEALQKKTGQTIPSAILPDGSLYPKLLALLQNFDPVQVRYVGQYFRALLDTAVKSAERFSQPWIAVPILREVILRLDPTSSTLTSVHLQFVHLCLRLKLYRDSLPVLHSAIYSVPPVLPRRNISSATNWAAQDSSAGYLNSVTGLTADVSSREYMQYFIWASLIHIALRKWQQALLFLEVVLMTPANNAASLIQVEAYKKYVLIGLLHTGKQLPLPRSVSQVTTRILRSVAHPYDVIAEDFVSYPARLQPDIEVGRQEGIWQKDGNLGLIQEVLRSFRKFAVLGLSRTFIALPIVEVARRTSPNASDVLETQQYVSSLIQSGEIKASITSDDPTTLRFLGGEQTSKTESELQTEIEKQKFKLSAALELVSSIDHRIEVSPEYVDHLRRLKRNKDEEEKGMKQSSGGGRKGEGPAGTTDPLDEDVMADT